MNSLFAILAHRIAGFFRSHQLSIQSALSIAQSAAKDAVAVATVLGEPPAVITAIGKISDGLQVVSVATAGEASANTLQDHANNLAAAATELVASGDIGIKNAATRAAVGEMAHKVAGVVGALEVGQVPVK